MKASLRRRVAALQARCGSRKLVVVTDETELQARHGDQLPDSALVILTGVPRGKA